MTNNRKIIAVMPAYNSAKTIEISVKAIPPETIDEIILVDDGSADDTSIVAKRLGLITLRHEKNLGYGAAQKTGFTEALKRGATVAVLVHSDFQYDPTLIPKMIQPIIDGSADACFGSRMVVKKDALKGGMPLWRFVANRFLSIIEESILKLGLSEYHTGYRAYSRKALLAIPFTKNYDRYAFDTEMLAQLSMGKFKVAEISIPTRYREESQSLSFWRGVQYGSATLIVMLKYLLHRWGLKSYPQFIINLKD